MICHALLTDMRDLAPSDGGELVVGFGVKRDGGKEQEERREGKLCLLCKIKKESFRSPKT